MTDAETQAKKAAAYIDRIARRLGASDTDRATVIAALGLDRPPSPYRTDDTANGYFVGPQT